MRVTIELDTENELDKITLQCAVKARVIAQTLFDMDAALRQQIKHGEIEDEKILSFLGALRDGILEINLEGDE